MVLGPDVGLQAFDVTLGREKLEDLWEAEPGPLYTGQSGLIKEQGGSGVCSTGKLSGRCRGFLPSLTAHASRSVLLPAPHSGVTPW